MEKYEKLRQVGKGASGVVHLYRRLLDGKLVIIKQIGMEEMTREERQTALNEVKILAMLDHPNIIQYFENFIDDRSLMIAMEYAPGGTLYDYLDLQNGQLLEEGDVLHFLAQLLLSLHNVHSKQILHRDLKTQNILMDKKHRVMKIGDFGISKVLSSKSKAESVVGTPCNMSPELCEGKPYNQKSDIWALGCVLYETMTLRKAFEAQTLPALILKILRGSVAPLPDKYSEELRYLALSLLQIDPSRRPGIAQVMASPLLINPILSIYTDLGAIPCTRPATQLPMSPSSGRSKEKASAHAHRSSLGAIVQSSVYMWGAGQLVPLKLAVPSPDTFVAEVAVGRTQKTAVTKTGRLLVWETPDQSTLVPGLSGPRLCPRFLEGQSAVSIQHVGCGNLFTTCLTDRGILMTFGDGTHGCLGHGNLHDVSQPKIVEALLGVEVVQVTCGTSHVLAVTNDRELFAWGRGDNGRLGLGDKESVIQPRQVPAPPTQAAFAGYDCSVLITTHGLLYAAGSNRYNKLGLDSSSGEVDESAGFEPLASPVLCKTRCTSVALGFNHTAVITGDEELVTLGTNQFGQLGHKVGRRTPGLVTLPGRCHMVACGDAFTAAVTEDGSIYTWGKGARGRLGRTDDDVDRPGLVRLPETGVITPVSLTAQGGVTLVALKVSD